MAWSSSHRYRSAAVVRDGTPEPEFTRDPELYYHPTTWPGARLPHVWLEHGRRARSPPRPRRQGPLHALHRHRRRGLGRGGAGRHARAPASRSRRTSSARAATRTTSTTTGRARGRSRSPARCSCVPTACRLAQATRCPTTRRRRWARRWRRSWARRGGPAPRTAGHRRRGRDESTGVGGAGRRGRSGGCATCGRRRGRAVAAAGCPPPCSRRWLGDEVVLLEKAPELGGTAKKAAFWYWVPNNAADARGRDRGPRGGLPALRGAAVAPAAATTADSPTLGLSEWEHAQIRAIYESASPAAELLAERGRAALPPLRGGPRLLGRAARGQGADRPRARARGSARESMSDGGQVGIRTMSAAARARRRRRARLGTASSGS